MNDAQRKIFIDAASMGVALGLTHRYEWYINAIRALGHGPYVDIADGTQKLREAFHAFEQTTASCGEEYDALTAMTLDGFDKMVDAHYRAARAKTATVEATAKGMLAAECGKSVEDMNYEAHGVTNTAVCLRVIERVIRSGL